MTVNPESFAAPAAPTAPPQECREWLAAIADLLIPAGDRMPAASEMDVAGRQLDLVLRARPDLLPHLLRAWAISAESGPQEAVDTIRELDSAAYDAVRMAVAGGYYTHPKVRELLGYTGQQPKVVDVNVVPAYVEEGLLERVMERGPIYRDA